MAITAEMRTSVLELYTAYFNRAADTAGVDYWLNDMDVNGLTLEEVSASFASDAQAEYVALYGGMTNAEVVTAVYTNVLNRDADAAGATYWTDELNAGTMNVSNLIQAVVNAAKEDVDGLGDADVLANKSAVSQHAYDAGSANTTTLLDAITSDAATITAVTTAIDAIVAAATVANIDALTAANTALVDFLVTADGDDDATTTASAGDAATAATAAVDVLTVNDGTYSSASTAVKAAMLADATSTLASTLTVATATQTAAVEAVTAIDGLTEAKLILHLQLQLLQMTLQLLLLLLQMLLLMVFLLLLLLMLMHQLTQVM